MSMYQRIALLQITYPVGYLYSTESMGSKKRWAMNVGVNLAMSTQLSAVTFGRLQCLAFRDEIFAELNSSKVSQARRIKHPSA